jgi:CHAT domain-containing protein
MTQFYKNLVSGQSKRQSLQSAQKYLREYNNGCFNEPKYWAAFILLDGIEKN